MPNIGKITIENPDEILNAGAYAAGALIRVQSAVASAGPFADVAGSGSTPSIAVVAGTRIYTFYDPAGTSSSWYRSRFENAGASRLSDWTDPFQVGDETAGLLCSLYDVQQELGQSTNPNDDELILEKIKQVSVAIEGYIGQWMAPRPTNPTSTTTLLFDVPWSYRGWYTRSVRLEYGDRIVGIRTLTALGIATITQPEVGGSYSTATLADVFLRPRPTADGPAIRLELTPYPTGAVAWFYPGYNTVQVTGSFGYAAVPFDIQGVAIRAATRRFIGKGGGGTAVAVGPNGTEILLPDMSGADRVTLDRYRIPVAA